MAAPRSPSVAGADSDALLSGAAATADRRLSALDEAVDFLIQATPVNARAAWEAFQKQDFRVPPAFEYRPLPPELDEWERELSELPLDETDDPVIARLLREKAEEMTERLRMLRHRGRGEFLRGSLRIHGPVEPRLLALAREILERLPAYEEPLGRPGAGQVDDRALARAARAEMAVYRRSWPSFPVDPELRDDLPPGLLVSRGRLLIGRGTTAAAKRVEALLHHEIGTHMVTWHNGAAQPLELLRTGLAGYEALQEGLGLFSEYVAGGLTLSRLRVLAARVLTAQGLLEGDSFPEAYRLLRDEHGFEPFLAFTICMRTWRGGGLLKDVVYLRGLMKLTEHLREGAALEPLFAGKLAFHHLPDLAELERRGILRPPPLRPRILDHPDLPARLARLQDAVALPELLARRTERVGVEEGPPARAAGAGGEAT